MVKKAELHAHLEGTISPDLARMLAKRNKLDVPDGLISPDNTHYLSDDFLHFLSVYDTVAEFIRVPQDYYDITFDYLAKSAADDVIYTEMMYSPDHAEKVSGVPSKEHVAAIEQALQDAEAKHGIVGRIITTGVRHFGAEAVLNVAKEAAKNPSPYVTGFGLGGDEAGFPPKLFEHAYQVAHDAGLGCTVHAGEFAPAEGMLEALTYLPIQRIGHGVRALDLPEVAERMLERGVAIESCPSSNVFFGLFSNLEEHPFPHLLEAGFSINLSSDDPPFVGTTVKEEYARVQSTFGYDDEQMRAITRMAVDAAFVDDETKAALRARC